MTKQALPASVPGTLNEDGSVTVTLAYPVMSEGAELREIRIKRLKIGVMRAFDGISMDFKSVLKLLQSELGLAPSTVDQFDAVDFDDITAVYVYFLGRDPETGVKLRRK